MAEPVEVTRVQRHAARLRITLADRRGETVSDAVRETADAKPRPTVARSA